MKSVASISAGLLFACLLFTPSLASAATPEEIISTRQANQKRVGDLSDEVKKALAAGASASSLLPQAQEIDRRAHLIKGYFPAGTETGGNTKAKPEIWTNRAGFDEAADKYVAAFDKLVVLAQAGDTPGFTKQFSDAGATCGACHRNFRNR